MNERTRMPGGGRWRDNDRRKPGARNNQPYQRWRGRGFRGKTAGAFKRKAEFTDSTGPLDLGEEDRKRLKTGDRLKEKDVGITEFMSGEGGGFFGIIKERYTDFHVHEIGLDGRVAKLSCQDTGPARGATQETQEALERLRKTVPEPIWEQLESLAGDQDGEGAEDSPAGPLEIDVTSLSKDQRRAIHCAAKSRLTNVISQTMRKEDGRTVVVIRRTRNRSDRERDQRTDWKKLGGVYCRFILHKVNMDTMDALNRLAGSLRIQPNNLAYAGTKDRRGCTSQWVSLRRGNPAKLLWAAKGVRGAFVGNFEYAREPLRLGMLHGNRFKIALRNVTASDELIERTMTSLRENGFINYYGLQRFGTVAAIPTYQLGKALLQGNWAEAIDLILKPREGELDRELAEARRIYQSTNDAFAAYESISRSDKIEAALLRGIQAAGQKNPQGALDSLPRNVRLMYIHAYQSYVWNHMVSKRIGQFGKNPIVGDLVYARESASPREDRVAPDSEQVPAARETATAADDDGDDGEDGEDDEDEDDDSNGSNDSNDGDAPSLPSVMALGEQDLDKYTLADVLMPQVGWKVKYPSYARSWFDEFLAKDGLTTDLRQKNKKYSLGGAYRKILAAPTDLHWKILRYKETHSDLLRSDIDELRNMPEPVDQPDAQYRGLIVEMTLKSSTYATMALREIVKCDTSPEIQAGLLSDCLREGSGGSDSTTAPAPATATAIATATTSTSTSTSTTPDQPSSLTTANDSERTDATAGPHSE